MDQSAANPMTNQLGPGVSEDLVRHSVERSGYPLQAVAANLLRKRFWVQEEWCYVDRDSEDLRSIDLRAQVGLHELDPQPRVRPQLTLIVECKQSQLPYVFFQSKSSYGLLDYPNVFGLPSSSIMIFSDDDPSTWSLSIPTALGLDHHEFVSSPAFCNTFSKCVRKGPELELSGTEVYGGLILPLIKALDHLSKAEAPTDTAWYFDAHLSIAVGVLDAPMVVARLQDGCTKLELVPWVRVVRHEATGEEQQVPRDRLWSVDIVHVDFLPTYLDAHLIPFAEEFSRRVLRHTTEIATGQAFVPKMGMNCWDDIESRMEPRQLVHKFKRTQGMGKSLSSYLLSRGKRQP
jgi:hypothetical protein